MQAGARVACGAASRMPSECEQRIFELVLPSDNPHLGEAVGQVHDRLLALHTIYESHLRRPYAVPHLTNRLHREPMCTHVTLAAYTVVSSEAVSDAVVSSGQ